MERRGFIAIFGGGLVAWPLVALAQQPAMPVIGYLYSGASATSSHLVAAFRGGLGQAGYVEGKNVAVEFRWAENKYDRLPAMAADLASRQVAVIFSTGGNPPLLAAKAATSTIPIVFLIGSDPVKFGFVASLSRPGGNITGVTLFTSLLVAKRMELLHELVPTAATVAFLVNPRNSNAEPDTRVAEAAARSLGLQLIILSASTEEEINAAFVTLFERGVGALLVNTDAFFLARRDQFAALESRFAVPTIHDLREYTAAGSLVSYGTNLPEGYRQSGFYVGRILNGAKPADLPVVQPEKFDLVINLKTARALRLDVSPTLLVRTNEVLE